MAQKAVGVDPGSTRGNSRGVGTTAGANKNARKTGYRSDAQVSATDNSNDPNALVRRTTDPRLT